MEELKNDRHQKCFGVFLPEECQASMNTDDFDILFFSVFPEKGAVKNNADTTRRGVPSLTGLKGNLFSDVSIGPILCVFELVFP